MAFQPSDSSSTVSRSSRNLKVLGFVEVGNPENPEKNRSKVKNQQQTQPTCHTGSGIKPETHWWEASALTTVPSLLSNVTCKYI